MSDIKPIKKNTENTENKVNNEKYSLRGMVEKYENPFEPAISTNLWEAMK